MYLVKDAAGGKSRRALEPQMSRTKAILKNTANSGQMAIILNCIVENGDFYYIVQVKKENGHRERLMLPVGLVEILEV